MHVLAVRDELDSQPVVGQRYDREAGFTLAERRHPVEYMRAPRRSDLDRSSSSGFISQAVSHTRDDTVGEQSLDELVAVLKLRSEGENLDVASSGLDEGLHLVHIDAPDRAGRLGSRLGRVQIRAFQVDARGDRTGQVTLVSRCKRLDDADHSLLFGGQHRQNEGGDTVPCQDGRHARQVASFIGVHSRECPRAV